MRFVYDNLAAIYVALVASLMGWLFGGTRADVLAEVVPWLMLFMVEIMIAFPQKHAGETTYEARARVWADMKGDPLVWTAVGFLLLLTIPFVNNGLCVSCDRVLIAQGMSPEPPVKFLPFCVNRLQHYNVFLWFAVALSAMVVTRHGLTRRGKRLVLTIIVWNGFALALLGFVQSAAGAVGPLWLEMTNVAQVSDFFSTFGYPNMAGDYFTTLCGLALALWRDTNIEMDNHEKLEHSRAKKSTHHLFWKRHLMLVIAGVFFFAAISTLSRAAIMLVSALVFICFIHSLIDITSRMPKKDRIRLQVKSVLIMSLIVFFAVITMPSDVQREIDTLDSDAVLTRMTGKGQYHVRVATEIWKDNVLFGCGGWGYKHFCVPKMTPDELKQIQTIGGINVHNDYLQLLAEHGLVGLAALAAIVVFLLMPLVVAWRRLVKAARFVDPKKGPAKPVQLFALPAPAFFVLLTALATFVHGFGDCPLRSPAVLTLFFVSLAALPGFLPKEAEHVAR